VRVAGLLLAAGAGRRLCRPKALLTMAGEPLVVRGVRLLAAGGCAPVAVAVGAAADQVIAALTSATDATGATDPAGRTDSADPPGATGAEPAGSRALTGDARMPIAQVVQVDDWAEGMGASLRAGLAALAAHDVAAVIVALVDQPIVSPALLRRLIAAADTATRATSATGATGADHGTGTGTGTHDGRGTPLLPAAVVASYAGQPRTPVLLRREVWPDVARLARGDVGARAWLRANPARVRQVPCDDVGAPDDIDTPADLELMDARPSFPNAGQAGKPVDGRDIG